MTTIYPVIMSGGAGTRLWPISRKKTPKQYHAILAENSMFGETLLRMKNSGDNKVAPPIVICSTDHSELVAAQSKALDTDLTAIILEPMARNTAAVGAIAASYVHSIDPEGLILLLPADHHIEDVDAFWGAVAKATDTASSGYLMTLGIHPSGPETGFGYIERGDKLAPDVYKIQSFKEKPDRETAASYIKSGTYSWNAGIFLFNTERLIADFQDHAADILEKGIAALKAAKHEGLCVHLDPELFSECRSDSIDYAIMEKTKHAAIVTPVEAGWNDIGSWAAISDFFQKHRDSNSVGNVKMIDCSNTHARSYGPFVAAIGLKNTIIVAMDDAVLIVDENDTQAVKQITQHLKNSGQGDLL